MTDQEMIDCIMDDFGFSYMHKVMVQGDWVWASIGTVPSEHELRVAARKHLKLALKNGRSGSGGLVAKYDSVENTLSLSFIPTSVVAYGNSEYED